MLFAKIMLRLIPDWNKIISNNCSIKYFLTKINRPEKQFNRYIKGNNYMAVMGQVLKRKVTFESYKKYEFKKSL